MAAPSAVFIGGTHIKASANKKKFQKERVAQTAKIYSEQLRQEVNAERENLGKNPIGDDEDEDDDDTPKGGGTVEFVVMDAGYKTPWIAKKTLDDGKISILPCTGYN